MAYLLPAGDDVSSWKSEIRERVTKNLEILLHDAQLDYLRRVAESRLTTVEERDRLFTEYNHEVQALRDMAEEQIKVEMDNGERERSLGTLVSEDLDQAFVEEQFSILNAIRSQAKVSSQNFCDATGKNHNTHFRQGSSSRPSLDAVSTETKSTSLIGSPTTIHPASETPTEREARLKREMHTKQQEEYRQKALEIQERKRRERQEREEHEWTTQLQFSETISCSSASSNTTTASEQDKRDGSIPSMSEDDVINLMIFHDQQWTWISSLPHLQWSDFPWPCLSFSGPKRKEDLTLEAIGEYVLAQFNIHQDRTIVKEHLKNLIRRWHPDRFEIKYLSRVADLHERDTVRDGAGIVTRILNDLLGKWNAQ